MAVIWGMDLRDMKWSNFKSSYMFGNTDYHMRRTKFIIYQLAMIFLIVSESLGTAVLSDYIDQQNTLQHRFPGITVFNNDFVGIASYNIFVGIFAAFVFGAAFFFDLFFPERYEPRWVQNLWMGCAIFTCLAATGDALAYTIILCLHGERISYRIPNDPKLQQDINRARNSTPILYRNSGRAIASVVFLWLGWACSIASTVVMCMFYRYVRKTGTSKSAHARNAEENKEFAAPSTPASESPEKPLEEPVSEPSRPEGSHITGGGRLTHYTITNDGGRSGPQGAHNSTV